MVPEMGCVLGSLCELAERKPRVPGCSSLLANRDSSSTARVEDTGSAMLLVRQKSLCAHSKQTISQNTSALAGAVLLHV